MSTTPSLPVTPTQMQKLAPYVQLAGVAAFLVGSILSMHHYAIGVCFIAGAAAFYIGQKMHTA